MKTWASSFSPKYFFKYIELGTNNHILQAKKGLFKGKLQGLKIQKDQKRSKNTIYEKDFYNIYLKIIYTKLYFRLHPEEFNLILKTG